MLLLRPTARSPPPWENLLPHLTPICPVAVLARCRVSCFCFSQIAPVFHPSTSHVHEQGTGLLDIGEAPVVPPSPARCRGACLRCRRAGGVLAMYLFPAVPVRVHLYSVRTPRGPLPRRYILGLLITYPTAPGMGTAKLPRWGGLHWTVRYCGLYLFPAGRERPCALPQRPKTRQIAPRVSHPRPVFPLVY